MKKVDRSILSLFERKPEKQCGADLAENLGSVAADDGDQHDMQVAHELPSRESASSVCISGLSNRDQGQIAGRNIINNIIHLALQQSSPPRLVEREADEILLELSGLASAQLSWMLAEKTSEKSEFFQKYVLQVNSRREGADEKFAVFMAQEGDAKRCYLVTGKAGKGKTNLLCHFADSLRARPGSIPALLSASELQLDDERSLRAAIIGRIFERSRGVSDLKSVDLLRLSRLITEAGGSLVIFIDGLNELEGTSAFRCFNDQLDKLLRECRTDGNRVLFCMSCRTEIWPHFKSADWAQNHIMTDGFASSSGEPTFEVGDFREDEIDAISQAYFHWYAIDAQLLGSARRSCCDPLMLRYLCAAFTQRGSSDKSTSPDRLPRTSLGAIYTLRRKEAFDSFVRNRRLAMFKAARQALGNDDDRLIYRYTTGYLITMAYRMYEKKLVYLETDDAIEVARELSHPDYRLAEKGREYFLRSTDSIFFRLLDEGVILSKHDQNSFSFTFESYFEYSLGRYIAQERWPRLTDGTMNECIIVDDFRALLKEHKILVERHNFHNLFGACHFAVLEIEQSTEGERLGGSSRRSPTLFIRLIEAMSQAAEEGFDWIQQTCATIRETAICQSAAWRAPLDRVNMERRFDDLIRVLDDLTLTSEWVVLWDLENTLSVLAAANLDLTLSNIQRWVEKGDGLQPIFGIQALLRLSDAYPEAVLNVLLQVAGQERFQVDFWLARMLIAAARALADPERGEPLSFSHRKRLRELIKSFAVESSVPTIRGVALAALPFISSSRELNVVAERIITEDWPWALWNLAFELQNWTRKEDSQWLWDALDLLSKIKHDHVRYAVDCALEKLKIEAPVGRAEAINARLRGNRWRKNSSREMGFPLSRKLGIVYSPAYLEPAYDNHPECRERIQVIVDKLEKVAAPYFIWVEPRMAKSEEILWVHKVENDQHRDRSPWPRYLEDVIQASSIRLGNPSSRALRSGPSELRYESYEASLLSAGGILRAVDYALTGEALTAWAISRPPGHLANNMICIFNNIAIAALYAREVHDKKRIFILDFDAHHGSHTYRVFRQDPDVLYFSIHQEGNYAAETGLPRHTGEGSGEGFTFNINYPTLMGDSGYVYIVESLLEPLLREWQPEIILLSAGFDGHFDDALAKGRLTENAYIHLAERIRAVALDLGIKVVATFEGGYSLEGTSNCLLHMLRILGDWPLAPEIIGYTNNSRFREECEFGLVHIRETVRRRVELMAELKARQSDYPFDMERPHWKNLLTE